MPASMPLRTLPLAHRIPATVEWGQNRERNEEDKTFR